jgi:hypothetical protein
LKKKIKAQIIKENFREIGNKVKEPEFFLVTMWAAKTFVTVSRFGRKMKLNGFNFLKGI